MWTVYFNTETQTFACKNSDGGQHANDIALFDILSQRLGNLVCASFNATMRLGEHTISIPTDHKS